MLDQYIKKSKHYCAYKKCKEGINEGEVKVMEYVSKRKEFLFFCSDDCHKKWRKQECK